MYFIRKIKKTKKKTSKSSFIVSIPKKLERRIASYDTNIAARLANFTRFRYFYEDVENPRCFMLCIWDDELPPDSIHDKAKTTTIQRSGKTSRYVIMPRKVCSRFGWGARTELVIGYDSQIDEYVHGAIYRNGNCFIKNDTPGQKVHVCVIKFQRYHDMKNLYRAKLAQRKDDLAKEESDTYWSTRNSPLNYDVIMKRIQYDRKNMHRLVWNKLESMNLVAISYTDFVKLRGIMEREKKRKRRQFLQKRFGSKITWRYRKDFVRSGGMVTITTHAVRRYSMIQTPTWKLQVTILSCMEILVEKTRIVKTSLKISNLLLNFTLSDNMAYENHDDVIAIDAGTGFVKCVSAHMRICFPSVFATRRLTRWEDQKEGMVEAVGYDAIKMSIYPDTVLVRAVLEGRIAEEKAFAAIIREAIRKLGCEQDLGSLVVVMGLPYSAAHQKQCLEKLVERNLKPRQVLVIPQSIGTLLSEDARTGIVLSIGQGTIELVLFEDLKPISGTSIPQACDYLYEDLAYLEHEKNTVDRKKIDALTTILANKLAVFKTKLNREYDIYLSGGGALVEGLFESLQTKVQDNLRIVKDPIYSNAAGLYKLGKIVSSSTEGQKEIHQSC